MDDRQERKRRGVRPSGRGLRGRMDRGEEEGGRATPPFLRVGEWGISW